MRLSIITINYNNIVGLESTVNSVLNQTSKDFEYIVIDGNSSDGSADYLNKEEGNFSYWVSEPDTGIYNAMNKGLKRANGEYLLFLNSGDTLVHEDVLKQVIQSFNSNFDIYYGNLNFDYDGVKRLRTYPDKFEF